MKKRQSYTGFVKERLAFIEARIELGYRQEAIKEEIEKGTSHTATLEGFRGALKKARKWSAQRKKEGKDFPLVLLEIDNASHEMARPAEPPAHPIKEEKQVDAYFKRKSVFRSKS
jgi:hypothetical protein